MNDFFEFTHLHSGARLRSVPALLPVASHRVLPGEVEGRKCFVVGGDLSYLMRMSPRGLRVRHNSVDSVWSHPNDLVWSGSGESSIIMECPQHFIDSPLLSTLLWANYGWKYGYSIRHLDKTTQRVVRIPRDDIFLGWSFPNA